MNTAARHVNAMGYDMADMSRYMRYMRNISTDMQGMTSYMQDMDATMRHMASAADDEDVLEHFSVLESQLKEMQSKLSGDGDGAMEKAMSGMKKAMSAFKGNSLSHDYSRHDGNFSMAMGSSDYDEDDDSEDYDDDDDDDYSSDLEEEVKSLRQHNEQLRTALRKTGAAYVLATNAYGISEDAVAEYMSVVNERKVEDFDRVKDFEEYVESVRGSFVGDIRESKSNFNLDPLSLLAESRDFSLTEGPLFANIKRLTGSR